VKVLLDTNVMTAGLVASHPHNPAAQPWLRAVHEQRLELVLAAHNLAELYSSLTSLPAAKSHISPPTAWMLISKGVLPFADFKVLDAGEYSTLIQSLSTNGLGGGIVYDAIIARVAELAGVDWLVTLNVSHFIAVWPGGRTRIVSPLSMSPLV
jgi:predicted nucleic acid-binding protein